MIKHIHTLTDYLLQEEQRATNASGSFLLLLTRIENAAKLIANQIRALGLVELLGQTGTVNTFGEEVQKLDTFANQLLVDTLLTSGAVYAIASEELEQPVFAPSSQAGEYLVYLDPIDGSSNIDTNCPVGTIFSVYHKDGGFLQPGHRQVASGYVMYGSSVCSSIPQAMVSRDLRLTLPPAVLCTLIPTSLSLQKERSILLMKPMKHSMMRAQELTLFR